MVHFNSLVSLPGSYSYLWDFGNGSTSTLINPTAIYTSATNATVKLQVWNTQQCTVTVVKPNLIQFNSIIPDFSLDAASQLCAPGTVTLFNLTSPSISGLSYDWYVNGVFKGKTKSLSYW